MYCNKLQLLLLLLVLCLYWGNTQSRLLLPQGYNMRLGSVPTRFVGKGAYTLAAKRPSTKWHQQAQPQFQQQLPQQQLQQQQLQQLQQQQQLQLQQRRQLFQWATMKGKKYT